MKCCRKIIIPLFSLSCLFSTAILASCSSIKTYVDSKSGKVLPSSYLKLSDDGTILYGLSDDITIQDIIMGGYDTLSIPKEVTKIEDYAFAYMFDHRTPSITKIVLNKELEEIGAYAFFKCSGLESINFDELCKDDCQLKKISKCAFSDCKLRCDVVLPTSLIEIGDNAFDSGIDNAKIVIPSSVQKVGFSAFINCTNIETLDLSQYREIPDWLYDCNSIFYNFAYDQAFNLEVLVDISVNALGQWQDVLFNYQGLPDVETTTFPQKEIRTTPPDAFVIKRYQPEGFEEEKLVLTGLADGYKLSDYDEVVVPDGVQVIAVAALSSYYVEPSAKLTVTLPSSLECIQDRAFYWDRWLVGFPYFSSYCDIGEDVFNKSGVGGVLDLSHFGKIGANAFAQCNFHTVIFSPTTIITKNSPFPSNPQIDTLDFTYFNNESAPPDLERGIEESSYFDGVFTCGKILWPPGKMTKMDKWNEFFAKTAFTGLQTGKWTSVEQVEETKLFPNESFITDYNQRNIYGLYDDIDINEFNTLEIPYTAQVIYDGAFGNKFASDDKFWMLKLHNGIKTIGNLAFYNDPKLIYNEQLPQTIESIGFGAFAADKGLSFDFRLPKNITTVESYAFYDCNNLWSTDLFINNNVTKLGDYAFGNWKYVKQITISRENDLVFGHKTFSNIQDLHTLDLSNLTFCPSISWLTYSDTFDLGKDSNGTVFVNAKLSDSDIADWEELLRNSGLTINENHWKVIRKT